MQTKRCPTCGEKKLHAEFSPTIYSSDGLRSACKECERQRCREQRAKKRAGWPVPMDDDKTDPSLERDDLDDYIKERWPDGIPNKELVIPNTGLAARLLVISDLHVPRQHHEALPFLAAVKDEFAPDRTVSVGDEADFHGLSFHDKDPNLPGPSHELEATRAFMQELAKLFPAMDIAESNHGSLPYRKALAAGFPEEVIKSYNDILQVPKLWRWVPDIKVNTKTGPIHIEHGEKATARTRSRHLGMSVIQGHRHPESYTEWWDNSLRPLFAVQAGCLINNQDRGFLYNKQNQRHPVISVAMVIDGEPFIIRLGEKKSGKWDLKIALTRAG